MARSCLYGAANACGGHLPISEPHQEVIDAAQEVLLKYEQLAYGFDAHSALAAVDEYARAENKRWGETSKAAQGNDEAYD